MSRDHFDEIASKLARDVDSDNKVDASMLLRHELQSNPAQALQLIQQERTRELQNGTDVRVEINGKCEVMVTKHNADGSSEGDYAGMYPGVPEPKTAGWYALHGQCEGQPPSPPIVPQEQNYASGAVQSEALPPPAPRPEMPPIQEVAPPMPPAPPQPEWQPAAPMPVQEVPPYAPAPVAPPYGSEVTYAGPAPYDYPANTTIIVGGGGWHRPDRPDRPDRPAPYWHHGNGKR